MFRLIVAATLIAPSFATSKDVDKTVIYTRAYGPGALPLFDKGHLAFVNRPNGIEVWGPDGHLMFHTTVTEPSTASVSSVAIDSDQVVVGLGYLPTGQSGYAGGIAFFDKSGKPLQFVDTGRFMPSHVCVDADHNIWLFGRQRSLQDGNEDAEDYMMFRKLSRDGRLIGSYVRRSLFPGKMAPGSAIGGTWRLRAVDNRLEAIAFSSDGDQWIELDLDGNLLGHWKIGSFRDGGTAVLPAGLCRQRHEKDAPYIDCFDRQSQTWKVRGDLHPVDESGRKLGILLGGDADHLVFGISDGILRLSWLPVSK